MDIKDPSVNEWDLQVFFGSEHVSRNYGDQWYDSDSLSLDENIFYDWQVCGAHDVHYIEEVTQSKLVVETGENEKCEILIFPVITLKHFSGSVGT